MQGGARGPHARRTRCTLSVRPRAPTKQMGLFQVRREGAVFLPVQVRPGELSVHPSSYRGSEEGNRIAEALGTGAHLGWVGKSTGRNACEARAGLERKS